MNFLLKLLKAKQRYDIRDGKLWKITRVFGMDVSRVEQEPPKAVPFKRPESRSLAELRNHTLKKEDDVTNLTKNPDLL